MPDLHDTGAAYEPQSSDDFLNAVLDGLGVSPKQLSPKWFYDKRGSELFEDITELDEYYPTRTEAEILRRHAADLARLFRDGTALVEIGSGASVKTRILLDALPRDLTYMPLDISAEFLAETADQLRRSYPGLTVRPVVADFTEPIPLPPSIAAEPKVVFFPGSTIGNLTRSEASHFLQRIRTWPGIEALVLGVDLVKDPDVLVAAYDDASGTTAAFDLNLLERINRELGGDFDTTSFHHEARWNETEERIEMHLVSDVAQVAHVADREFRFFAGESIHTENSHKFTDERLRTMAARSGWAVTELFTDDADLFGVAVLRPAPTNRR